MPLSDSASWLLPAVFLGLALLFFMFRAFIARGLLYLILTPTRRSHPDDYPVMIKELKGPLGLFLSSAFLAAACHAAFFIPAPWLGLLARLADTLLTGLGFWLLYKLSALAGLGILRRKSLTSESSGSSAVSLLVSMIRVMVLVVGAFVILSYWVSNVAGLVTGLGIGGLALTLAAQDTIGNFIGGIAILLEQPFQVGDWISSPDAKGRVEAIGIRSSKLRASSGALISVPNKTLAAAVVTNESRREHRRIEMELTLPWEGADRYDLFRERLLAYLEEHPAIEDSPELVLQALPAEGLSLYISCYTGASYSGMLETRDRINRAAMAIARDLGFSLQPSRQIRLQGDDAILKDSV